MADVVDRSTRSRMMAGISAKDTVPERALRRELHARGFRFRIHVRNLPGTPDIVFPRYSAVCFVHGCFWHRHPGCPYATMPATRPDFWNAKFKGNIKRDQRSKSTLLEAGWRVAIVWECSLRGNGLAATARGVERWLESGAREYETSSAETASVEQP
ncbi:very short patch repair endonuclease [Candidatus Foliamicus sp.]